jgi:hypothetical protein
MIYRASVCIAALCLLALTFAHATAQTPTVITTSSVAKESSEKGPQSKRRKSASTAAERDYAVSIVMSIANESDTFKDQALRVYIQAHAADALWETDSVLAHNLFLRAWKTADNIDREGQRDAEEARTKLLTSHQGITFIPPAPNLRSEVLNLAARHDWRLGEDLLAEMEETKEQEATVGSNVPDDNKVSFFDPTQPPPATARRLELAIELIKVGDVERAKRFADPSLDRVTSPSIMFISTLRQKDAAAADERYSRLLALTVNDPSSDATAISLLSSYVFTPNILVTATRRGRLSNDWGDIAPSADLPVTLRPDFLKVAADVLLRPILPSNQDRTSAGKAGTYFTIARLLPLFEQYAPDYLPALNARLSILAPDTPEVYKNNDNGMLTLGLVPKTSGGDDLEYLLNQISHTVGDDARDLLYIKAIRAAATKGDSRIREFPDRIENADLRKWARPFADFVAVRKALAEKDVEGTVRIISAGGMSPIQRVWAYTEVASLLKQSDAHRATQLLNEATSQARSINSGEVDRIYALSCVASRFFVFDRERAWEIADDVVNASNTVPKFTPSDSRLAARLQARGVVTIVNVDVPSFNITSLFELLAKDDFQRAADMAYELKSDAARATVNLAIAHSLLTRQKKN